MKFRWSIGYFIAILLTNTLVVSSVSAQEASPVESVPAGPQDEYSLETDIAKNPLKPPDTSSPRATLESFLEGMNRAHRVLMVAHGENLKTRGLLSSESVKEMARHAEELFERGVYCLNLNEVPPSLERNVGYERALHLKELFDRLELPPFHLIPDTRAVEQEEEEKRNPKLFRWRVPNTDIVIARVEEGPRKGEYLFTPQTVARAGEFYEKVKDLPYKSSGSTSDGFLEFYIGTPGRLLPPKWSQWLPAWSTVMYLGQTIWQWFALAVWSFICLALVAGLYRWVRSRTVLLPREKRLWIWALFAWVVGWTSVGFYYVLDDYVNLTGSLLIVINTILGIMWWFLGAIATFLAGRAVAETIVASPKIDPEGIQASYVRALFGIVGFVTAAAYFVFGLSRVGVSLVPLLAGVGIGGLAVALAARPLLENIIGSFMIFADNPYRVGQRVKAMEHDGTVESIGLRSTKIRLLSGHVTSIPNEKMSASEIENISRRPYIRRVFNVAVTYDTPPEKINRAVDILREILAVPDALDPETNHSTGELVDTIATDGKVEQESHPNEAINKPGFPPRVFFNELNADSLNIAIFYWYHPPNYWDYSEHAHWVNVQIMKRFNVEGIDFAFPTQTLHLAGDDKRPLSVDQRQLSK